MNDYRSVRVLSLIAAILTILTAGYSIADSSVYPPTVPVHSIPGAIGQDMVSLLAAGGILFCLFRTGRGETGPWLLLAGLLGYLFYGYALYSFDRVYNQLFPAYLAILGLSAYSLIIFFLKTGTEAVSLRGKKKPPRIPVAVLFLFLALLFLSLWSNILIPALSNRVPAEGNAIFVLDLSFFIPLIILEAVFLFQRKPAGDLIAVPLLMKMGTLGVSVFLGVLVRPFFGGVILQNELFIYALLGFGPLALLPVYFRRIQFRKGEQT